MKNTRFNCMPAPFTTGARCRKGSNNKLHVVGAKKEEAEGQAESGKEEQEDLSARHACVRAVRFKQKYTQAKNATKRRAARPPRPPRDGLRRVLRKSTTYRTRIQLYKSPTDNYSTDRKTGRQTRQDKQNAMERLFLPKHL